ncbi:uncharacterized protein LOC113359856 [Papaver somniferum]|uniref:uncharacterized protein LOC113359856 n=1 Tax=Papaver somniferum TaxID=3469 RepID=UPI000E70155B|nr:uncharacterized protein LOC113359856 [Papaver somniferum]
MQHLLCRETFAVLLQISALNTSTQVTTAISPELQELISTCADVFKTPTSLPPERLQDHRIYLTPDSAPVNVRPYRYPHFQKDKIKKIVYELQHAGLIRPSSSPYSSPILIVRKKDGSWRMCVDYRALNKLSMKDCIPIPMVDELLDELHGASLYVKESKCTFAQHSVKYLGHVISSEGVSVDQDKVQCILSWPIPTTIKDLRGFLGLTGYYHKFAKDFGKLSAPLTQLLKKDAFSWNDNVTAAFKLLQKALTTTPILILPDFSKEFSLEYDVFGDGLGAQKLLSKLLGYDCEIIFRQGKENVAADALSRNTGSNFSLTAPIFSGVTEIIQEFHNDAELSILIQQLIDAPTCKLNFSYVNGVLRYKGRMKRSVKDFIAQCDVCQRNKAEAITPPGLLNPLPIPADVWIDISMEFIDGFPSSDRKSSILVVVDCLTKYARFIALTHPSSASSIAEIFVREIVRLHGMQRSIVSDRDPIFMSNFWDAYFTLQNTKLCRSSAYHPQYDGQTKARDHTLKLLISHLHDAQARVKAYIDAHRTEREFSIGDWVYLRLQPYRQRTITNQSFSKLSPRFYGPFRVLEWVGSVAYKLELPAASRIHPVFHVSLLKLKIGSTISVEQVLPSIIDYDKRGPESVLERKLFKKGSYAGTKWLVKWMDHPQEEATWEDADELLLRFPAFEA